MMPLHVFEPRYRKMVRDALDSHRALAVVLVTDPGVLDQYEQPQIAKMAGAGVIVDFAELPSGRFNILVKGRARVELSELPFVSPYRRARAAVIVPPEVQVSQTDTSALVAAAAAFTARVRERDPSFEFPLPKDAQPGLIADVCAHYLVLDARERQAVLETLDPVARVRRVTETLTLQRLTLSSEPRDIN